MTTVAAFAVMMMGTTIPTPLYAIYGSRFSFGVLTTTVIFAAYAAGVIAALLLCGRWSDVFGRKPLLLGGAALAAVSAVIFLMADGVPLLLLGRIVSGLSAGIYTGTATAAVIEAAPASWRSRAPAVATAANIGGLGLGPLVSGLLAEYAPDPLHTPFFLNLTLIAVTGIALCFIPEPAAAQGNIEQPDGDPGTQRPRGRQALRHLRVQRLSVPPEVRGVFAGPAIAAFAGFAVLGTFTAIAPSFVSQLMGISNHAVAGAVVALLLGVSALTQILGRHLPTDRSLILGCAVLVVGVACMTWALAAASFGLLLAGAAICGMGQGFSFSKGLAAVVTASPADRRAEVTSTYFVIAYIALCIPIIGQGLAADRWGLVSAGIGFNIGVGVLSAVALGLIVLTVRRAPAE